MTPQQALSLLRQVQANFTATGADHAKIAVALDTLTKYVESQGTTPADPPPAHDKP